MYQNLKDGIGYMKRVVATMNKDPVLAPMLIYSLEDQVTELQKIFNMDGGAGSGNFGHAGRPGSVGGSSSKFSIPACTSDISLEKYGITDKNVISEYNKRVEHEKGITNTVVNVAEATNMSPESLETRLKTAKSTAGKIEREQEKDANKHSREKEYPIRSQEQIMKEMCDVNRYTLVGEHEEMAQNVSNVISELENRGMKIVGVTNKWTDYNTYYNGIHLYAMDKNGIISEIQIHSKESLDVKNNIHEFYEEERTVGTTPARKEILNNQMKMISEKVPMPNGVDQIKTFWDQETVGF